MIVVVVFNDMFCPCSTETMHDILGPHIVSELVFDMSQVHGFLYVNCYPVSTTDEKLKTQLSQTDLVAYLKAEGTSAAPATAPPAVSTSGKGERGRGLEVECLPRGQTGHIAAQG